jgi:hypothetical protein
VKEKAKPGNGPFIQILVAVAIALLVGGSAPWWWHEVKGMFRSSADAPASGSSSRSAGPEKSARDLLSAWNRKDRDAALKVAGRSAVDKLFAASELQVNSKDMTCYPSGTGQRDCHMPHAKGVLIFRIMESDRGWRVETVEY